MPQVTEINGRPQPISIPVGSLLKPRPEARKGMIHKRIGRLAGRAIGAMVGPGVPMGKGIMQPQYTQGEGSYFEPGTSNVQITSGVRVGAEGECPPGYSIALNKCSGELYCKKNRKRRKKMLTCGDRADIAFVVGQLGKGAAGQAAVSALLTRCL